MASNLSKIEVINNSLDKKIKNLKPSFRESMFNTLIDDPSINSIASCLEVIYQKLIPRSNLTRKSKKYWIVRGWSADEAYIKSKENKQKNCKSIYSRQFWLEKINPATSKNYTIEEADFERNSRRPIRKEYWIKKGYTESESIDLALKTKDQNNKKGAAAVVNSEVRRITSKRCIEYYTARGFDEQEATKMLSESQKFFSKEICIKKYGQIEGEAIWSSRQQRWQATLSAKSSEEKARINRLKLSKGITVSKAEKILLEKIKLVVPDVVHQFTLFNSGKKQYVYDIMANKKIIEYHGDFWHSNPDMYESEYLNPRTKIRAVDRWALDDLKLKFAQQQGYEVLVVWENDFKKNKNEIIDKCIQFLTQ